MKKFLIFVLGLVIGAAAVYFLSPCTLKSQKVTSRYEERIDSLVREGERLTKQLRMMERVKGQIPKPMTQSKPSSHQSAAQPKPLVQPKPQPGQSR